MGLNPSTCKSTTLPATETSVDSYRKCLLYRTESPGMYRMCLFFPLCSSDMEEARGEEVTFKGEEVTFKGEEVMF